MMLNARRLYRPRETLAFVGLWERWRGLSWREQFRACRGRQSNKVIIKKFRALAHVLSNFSVYHLEK